MSLFKDMLKDDESLFVDTLPLDVDFTPPIVKYRENEQQYIATCIKPLFQKRSGKNLLIMGAPGIGKTIAVQHVLNELKKETDDIETLYVNCWKKETPYKIALDLCDQLNFKFTHNRDTTELLQEVAKIINKKSAVIVLDEVDKLTDQQALYTLIEDIFRKTLILITNDKDWISTLDSRVKSRLIPDLIEFKPYNYDETNGIIKQRIEYAFVPNVWENEAIDLISEKTAEKKDIRAGLFLLKESGNFAEMKSSKKITLDHAKESVKKLDNFHSKSVEVLDNDEKQILDLIKDNNGKSTKQLYDTYKDKKGALAYTTFQRKVKALAKNHYITLKQAKTGKVGQSIIVEFGNKTLDQF